MYKYCSLKKHRRSPLLDSFPLAKLALYRYTGTKLRPGLKICELRKISGFENSGNTPLLIRYADALPVIHEYSQTVKEVPQETMELLHNYIVTLTRRLSSFIKQSQRLHFIAPILVYVSELFGPQVTIQIVINEDLNGLNVKANEHFEFMLKRKNKRICIVQAKKDDMEQGWFRIWLEWKLLLI
jgi:hypothetical protein